MAEMIEKQFQKESGHITVGTYGYHIRDRTKTSFEEKKPKERE